MSVSYIRSAVIHLLSSYTYLSLCHPCKRDSTLGVDSVTPQHNMRGIITEMMRALQQAAAVTVSHGPTIAPRLDKNLT